MFFLNKGFSLESFKGVRCWNDTSANAGKHIIRAEEMANWLTRSPIPGLGPTLRVDGQDYQSTLSGKTGIIFFKDYWRRGAESFENRSGDHIDLWDGSKTKGYLFGWTRDLWENWSDRISDRNDSRQIWFWEVK